MIFSDICISFSVINDGFEIESSKNQICPKSPLAKAIVDCCPKPSKKMLWPGTKYFWSQTFGLTAQSIDENTKWKFEGIPQKFTFKLKEISGENVIQGFKVWTLDKGSFSIAMDDEDAEEVSFEIAKSDHFNQVSICGADPSHLIKGIKFESKKYLYGKSRAEYRNEAVNPRFIAGPSRGQYRNANDAYKFRNTSYTNTYCEHFLTGISGKTLARKEGTFICHLQFKFTNLSRTIMDED